LNALQDENAKAKRTFQTLLRIVGNIAKNPNEEKYRRIRLNNPAFQVAKSLPPLFFAS
jgi:UBX domain-containing protein 1/4